MNAFRIKKGRITPCFKEFGDKGKSFDWHTLKIVHKSEQYTAIKVRKKAACAYGVYFTISIVYLSGETGHVSQYI